MKKYTQITFIVTMAKKTTLIPEFDPEKLSLDSWLDLFEMAAVTSNITDDQKKKALLLSVIGVETFAVICKLTSPDKPSSKSFSDIKGLLTSHFYTAPSYHKALTIFLRRKKVKSESAKEFYAELKQLAHPCDFDSDFDKRLKEQLLIDVEDEIYFTSILAEDFDFKR